MSVPEDQNTKYENKLVYNQSTEDWVKYVHNWGDRKVPSHYSDFSDQKKKKIERGYDNYMETLKPSSYVRNHYTFYIK